MKAFLAEPAEAESCWRQWRAETGLEHMSEDCVRLLPVLMSRCSTWLKDDPSRNLILGICKRAWTRNQLLLRPLAELTGALQQCGVQPLFVAGPPAMALMHQESKSFRPIGYLELVVARAHILQAAKSLAVMGWILAPGSEVPVEEAFDYASSVWFRRESGEALKLAWRLFPAPPEFAVEWESLPAGQPGTLPLVPKEALLASALLGSLDGGDLDWRCDAILLLRQGGIDWRLIRKWTRFSPDARKRLRILAQETGLQIPSGALRDTETLRWRAQWEIVWGDYRRRIWIRRESGSVGSFLLFLRERWQAPLWQVPFLSVFYVLRYSFPGRGGGQ
jgi:hypothetical protein